MDSGFTPPLYKNYAFISYSRQDDREVRWLHKALEDFRIPTGLPKPSDGEHPPKRLRPVFRDKQDLEVQARSFVEQIERELAASRFLIVVCSPNAARSRPDGKHYVDWEIRRFIQAHGVEYARSHTLPVILAGSPGCGDPERECLPPALREFGPSFLEHNFPLLKDLPTDKRGEAEAREDCVIGCVSFLLGVEKATIRDRHLRAQRERMRQLVSLAVAVVLALGALSVWAVVERNRAETERGRAETARQAADSAKNDALAARDLAKTKQAEAEAEKKRADEQAQLAIQQRDEAEKQQKVSGATLKFLTGLFYSIDPEVAKSHEVTVREVLEKADTDLAREPERFPLAEATIRTVVAQTYDKLGLYGKALEQGQAVLRLAENVPELIDLIGHPRLYNNIGFWMDNTGDSDGAVEMYSKALKLFDAHPDRNDMDMAQLFDNYGNCALRLGCYAEAEVFLIKALDWRKEADPEGSAVVVQSLNNLGVFLQEVGRYSDAVARYEEAKAMEMRLNKEGVETLMLARIEGNIALCYYYQKRFAEALGDAELAVTIRRRMFKTENKELAIAINNRGLCLAGLGRCEEAVKAYEEARAMIQRVLPGDLADTAAILDNQGAVLCMLRRYPEALAKQSEALAMRRRIHGEGEDHVDVARNLNNVAMTYGWMGEKQKAWAAIQESLGVYDRVFAGDHPDKIQALDNLAFCLDQLGNSDEAARCRARGFDMQERLRKASDAPAVETSTGIPSL